MKSLLQQAFDLPVRIVGFELLKFIILIVCISLVFYNNLFFIAGFIWLFPVYIKRSRKKYRDDRDMQFRAGFSEAIGYMSAALESGYSAENAVREAFKEMSSSHESDEGIMLALDTVVRRIENNVSLENAMILMTSETNVREAAEFAEILSTAKRTGGDIIAVIKHTSGVLERRAELMRSIRSAMAEKKFEADIMKYVPLGIMVYLRIASPGFLNIMYNSLSGVLFMSVILILYAVFVGISDRLTTVQQ